MELQDYPCTTQPLFMPHNYVREYLEGYSQHIREECNGRLHFHFDTEVIRLFHESYAGGHWVLTWKSVLSGDIASSQYLYVVVAGGAYDEPWIPHYEGLRAWKEKWANSISHAKSYRSPDAFKGKVSSMFSLSGKNQYGPEHTKLTIV